MKFFSSNKRYYSCIIFSIIFCIFLLNSSFVFGSKITNTVPVEGGYGTISDGKIKITGTFHRNWKWCKDCVWIDLIADWVVKGDLVYNEILVPKSFNATLEIDSNGAVYEGEYFYGGDQMWYCGKGKVTYKDKIASVNDKYCEMAIAAGINIIEEKFFSAKVQEEESKQEQDKNASDPFYGLDLNDIIPAATGSGFFISKDGKVVTNFHVIDSCDTLKIFYDGIEHIANSIAQDTFNDLSLLVTSAKPNIYYKISDNNVGLLEDIIVAGYPLGRKVSSSIKSTKGSVTSLSGYGDNFSNFQIDAALNQGNSGGPIIDNGGNVVGVAVAAYGKEEGVESFNFGIKSSVLKNFLESNNINYEIGTVDELERTKLANLITKSTVFIECWMTVKKIKLMLSYEDNMKAMLPLN